MKQILQNLGNGETLLAEVPAPGPRAGCLLIATRATLVSLGTEKMLVDFGKAGWIAKARSQPDKVKQVLQKVRTDGLLPTLDAVRSKLDQPIPLGYCNAGVVVGEEELSVVRCPLSVEDEELSVDSYPLSVREEERHRGAQSPQTTDNKQQTTSPKPSLLEEKATRKQGATGGFAPGDRVLSNGPHAEVVSVPHQLCAKIPDNVSDEAATFTVVGAIGLQGIRLLAPTLGESVVVTGLGLIGLLTVQMLRANGCKVLGLDFDSRKCELARQFGAEALDLAAGADPVAFAEAWTNGRGVDGVIITASTASDAPVSQAAHMCRKRGRIVLVGVAGLKLNRDDFYKKELSFQVSCSYGPGRYDAAYEDQGLDYPIGHVRWTEQRNFEAVLAMMADGLIDVAPLISHRYPIESALDAYATVAAGKAMGIILQYPDGKKLKAETLKTEMGEERDGKLARRVTHNAPAPTGCSGLVRLSVIGAGNFTTRTLLPVLKSAVVRRRMIVSAGGVSAAHAATKFGFEASSTDTADVLADPQTDAVLITTRHDAHARQVLAALTAGKHVFVEKPLALTLDEIDAIEEAVIDSGRILMVGFNRRFAPLSLKIKSLLAGVPGPKSFIATINAGAIPADHWTQDPAIGGGRIVGEACHFIDLLRDWAGATIEDARIHYLGGAEGRLHDTATVSLTFSDGSIGAIHYLATGDKGFPKERFEVFAGGRILQLDNFRTLRGWGWKNFSKASGGHFTQDKGHAAGLAAFIEAVAQDKPSPISLDEIIETSRWAVQLAL
ncbi:MAG: bi-domain-containing oxidoreductase [Verrucomicrobiota bacterium]